MKFKCPDKCCTFPSFPLDVRLGYNRVYCHRCKKVIITKIVPVKFEDPEVTELLRQESLEEFGRSLK